MESLSRAREGGIPPSKIAKIVGDMRMTPGGSMVPKENVHRVGVPTNAQNLLEMVCWRVWDHAVPEEKAATEHGVYEKLKIRRTGATKSSISVRGARSPSSGTSTSSGLSPTRRAADVLFGMHSFFFVVLTGAKANPDPDFSR